MQEIEENLETLLQQARNIRNISDNKAVRATTITVEIIIHISWPWKYAPRLNTLIGELQESLLLLPVRGCSYMDFTSCQHLIGAIVAQQSTSTQAWFVNKLTSAANAMRSRGWQQPFQILEDLVRADARLTEWIRIFWNSAWND